MNYLNLSIHCVADWRLSVDVAFDGRRSVMCIYIYTHISISENPAPEVYHIQYVVFSELGHAQKRLETKTKVVLPENNYKMMSLAR